MRRKKIYMYTNIYYILYLQYMMLILHLIALKALDHPCPTRDLFLNADVK